MDQPTLWQHLDEADRQIAQGRAHIDKQRAIIADLERDGHDTTQASALLETLLESQRLHERRRATILRQLKG